MFVVRQVEILSGDRKHRRECLAGRFNRKVNVGAGVSGTEESCLEL